ncbi:MAG: hypothetical protein ACT4O6_01295 [Reyranella sp.]
MLKLMMLVLGTCLYAGSAYAQSPVEMLKGTWVAENRFCGKSIYKIDRVDEKNGIVYGSFSCLNTQWHPSMGEKVGRNDVKGTLVGNRFVMVNEQGGGSDLIVSATKLEGTGKVKADSSPSPTIFVKQ